MESSSNSNATSAAGWSVGSGPEGIRFSHDNEDMAPFAVKEPLELPHSGIDFLKSYTYQTEKLSNGQTTDVEWSVAQASMVIVKGTISLELAREVLKEEGVYPVQCIIGGVRKAMVSIWSNLIRDSMCGTYNECIISFDVHKTDPNMVAFDDSKMLSSLAYAVWYNNFGSDVCEAQYLHTLYVDSPLSIMWGREMQAFPKHPDPATSEIRLGDVITSEFRWDGVEAPMIRVETREKFGFLGFCKEGMGLVRHVGFRRMAKFLTGKVFNTNIVMPSLLAAKYNRPQDYTGTIWKGLNPMAVKVWPWDAATDKIEWNASVTRNTGCEANNGAQLLEKGGFTPLSVSYLPKVSGVVMERSMT